MLSIAFEIQPKCRDIEELDQSNKIRSRDMCSILFYPTIRLLKEYFKWCVQLIWQMFPICPCSPCPHVWTQLTHDPGGLGHGSPGAEKCRPWPWTLAGCYRQLYLAGIQALSAGQKKRRRQKFLLLKQFLARLIDIGIFWDLTKYSLPQLVSYYRGLVMTYIRVILHFILNWKVINNSVTVVYCIQKLKKMQ